MQSKLYIQNLKCGGCATTILKSLRALPDIRDVSINTDDNSVCFELEDVNKVTEIKSILSHLGYPVVNDPNSIIQKAKSYVSCAIGKVENMFDEKV